MLRGSYRQILDRFFHLPNKIKIGLNDNKSKLAPAHPHGTVLLTVKYIVLQLQSALKSQDSCR